MPSTIVFANVNDHLRFAAPPWLSAQLEEIEANAVETSFDIRADIREHHWEYQTGCRYALARIHTSAATGRVAWYYSSFEHDPRVLPEWDDDNVYLRFADVVIVVRDDPGFAPPRFFDASPRDRLYRASRQRPANARLRPSQLLFPTLRYAFPFTRL